MPADSIPAALLSCVATIDRLLTQPGSPAPGSAGHAKLEDLVGRMLDLQHQLDDQPIDPPGNVQVPIATVGHDCGCCWAMRVAAEKGSIDVVARSFFGWMRTRKQPPSLHEAACELCRPKLTTEQSAEFWSQLWQGPELAALDQNEIDRAEFWEHFKLGAQTTWQALREAKR